MRLPITRPPLFIILKQLNTTPEQLFYTTLEERGSVRDLMVERLTFSEHARALAEKLRAGTVHLFMQFSAEMVMAMEQIDRELGERVFIDTIMEEGALNDHMMQRYF